MSRKHNFKEIFIHRMVWPIHNGTLQLRLIKFELDINVFKTVYYHLLYLCKSDLGISYFLKINCGKIGRCHLKLYLQ